jgi:hypothetical protein
MKSEENLTHGQLLVGGLSTMPYRGVLNLSSEIRVEVHFVDAIPVDKSGKLMKVISKR